MSEFGVLIAATFSSSSSSTSSGFLTLAMNRGHVFEASERPVFLRGLDINLDEFAQIENNVAADSPPASSVAPSFDRE